MTRFAPLLLLPLLLAGCGSPPYRSYPPMTDAACKRASEEDPLYRKEMERFAGNSLLDYSIVQDAQYAAYDRCLRMKGIRGPGGVERIQNFGY
jgi:hypothetical protein